MSDFLCGTAEGFYGRPWTRAQRHRLFDWSQRWGLNAYLYAPKDDLKHRTRWRELYSPEELTELRDLIQTCEAKKIRFLYAIGPGLDYNAAAGDADVLWQKISQVHSLGCRHFALLYDDLEIVIAERLLRDPGAVAKDQADSANTLLRALNAKDPGASLTFCPTDYCGRKTTPSVRESVYLQTLGRELEPAIGFFWTGPEIVSEQISVESIRELRAVIRRKPTLWDNLHANDYDLRRVYLGPYAGREAALRDELAGILSNPNCEFEANFIPLHTLAAYKKAGDTYDAAQAYSSALAEWEAEWKTAGPAITASDIQYLTDCCYLLDQFGPRATDALKAVSRHFAAGASLDDPDRSKILQFIAAYDATFQKMPALLNRDLFYSLLRYAWELNEELQLLKMYLDWLGSKPSGDAKFFSAQHRAGYYRGGFVAELQTLLPRVEGSLTHRISTH